MQLTPDHGLTDEAIKELERAISLEVLQSVYDDREQRQVRRDHIRRKLEMLEAAR